VIFAKKLGALDDLDGILTSIRRSQPPCAMATTTKSVSPKDKTAFAQMG
jgi:hypothetical protein